MRYQTKIVIRTGQGQFFSSFKGIAVFMAIAGAALFGLMHVDQPPPTLAGAQEASGRINDVILYPTARNGSRYLRIVVAGKRYVYSAARENTEQLASQLRLGEIVVVWSTPILGGEHALWQLSSNGHIIVPFSETHERAVRKNARTVIVVKAIAVISLVCGLIGFGGDALARSKAGRYKQTFRMQV